VPGMSREAAPSAGAGKAGGTRKLGIWLTRWWSRTPDGRVYQRSWADILVPAAGLGLVIVCGFLVAPYLKGWWKVLPWALAAAVCLSRLYLGAHFPLDVIAGAGLGMLIGGVLNLVFGVPSISANGFQ
jgi:hypothetical protein